jgi:hypothetical protein
MILYFIEERDAKFSKDIDESQELLSNFIRDGEKDSKNN